MRIALFPRVDLGHGLLCALVCALAFYLAPAPAYAFSVVLPPRRLDTTEVPYPASGKGDASVVLVLVVERNGEVTDALVREGSPPFTDAAVAGVRTWKFAPATRDGTPVAARITATVSFHAPAPAAPAPAAPAPLEKAPTPPHPLASAKQAPVEVSVKGEREEPSTIHIPRTEARVVPGTFGDPLKIVEALPGMAPWRSGLPYYYVRGSPPENVGYSIDGIRVPLLFHVGPGPSTIAPALVDSVDLFPGAYPARYGRYTGAIIAAETAPPEADRVRGEFSARIYDANAFVEAPYDEGRGTVAAAARYAYAGPLTSVIVPKYSLGYWDYQLRVSHRIGDKDTVTLFAFGAHDELHYLGQPTFSIEYHRVDLRYDHGLPGGNLRVAATFNDDDTLTALQTNTGAGANAALKGPGGRVRAELDEKLSQDLRLRAGADIGATHYTVDNYPSTNGFPAVGGPHTDVEGGLYGDVVWRPIKPLEIVPGLRLDGYDTRGRTSWAPQPRLSTRLQVSTAVAWISALGTAHQEPTEEILVPSKIPSPIDQAAQTIYQFSEGAEVRLPSRVRLRGNGFYSRFLATHILGTPYSEEGQTYGLEFFLQRDFTERLGGFVAYTLSRTIGSAGGVTERVSWDRTHVVSVVVGYDLGRGWRAGARLFVESGRPLPPVCVANCTAAATGNLVFATPPGNLPAFWRVDARIEKKWTFSGGQWLAGTLECFNIFQSTRADGRRLRAERPLRDRPESDHSAELRHRRRVVERFRSTGELG